MWSPSLSLMVVVVGVMIIFHSLLPTPVRKVLPTLIIHACTVCIEVSQDMCACVRAFVRVHSHSSWCGSGRETICFFCPIHPPPLAYFIRQTLLGGFELPSLSHSWETVEFFQDWALCLSTCYTHRIPSDRIIFGLQSNRLSLFLQLGDKVCI